MKQQPQNDTKTEPVQPSNPYLSEVIRELTDWITGARHFRKDRPGYDRLHQEVLTRHDNDRSGLHRLLASFAAALLAMVWGRVDEKVAAAVKAELDARAVVAPKPACVFVPGGWAAGETSEGRFCMEDNRHLCTACGLRQEQHVKPAPSATEAPCVFVPGEFEDDALPKVFRRKPERRCALCHKLQSEHHGLEQGAANPLEAAPHVPGSVDLGGMSRRFVDATCALNLLLHGSPAQTVAAEAEEKVHAALAAYERERSEMAQALKAREADVAGLRGERHRICDLLDEADAKGRNLAAQVEDLKASLSNHKDTIMLLEAELAARPQGRAATAEELYDAYWTQQALVNEGRTFPFVDSVQFVKDTWQAVAAEAARRAGLPAPTLDGALAYCSTLSEAEAVLLLAVKNTPEGHTIPTDDHTLLDALKQRGLLSNLHCVTPEGLTALAAQCIASSPEQPQTKREWSTPPPVEEDPVCVGYQPGEWGVVSKPDGRQREHLCKHCDRPEAEHGAAPRSSGPEHGFGVEPYLLAAEEQRAPALTPKADAEMKVWEVLGSPLVLAKVLVLDVEREVDRAPSAHERRAVAEYLRTAASELVATLGGGS